MTKVRLYKSKSDKRCPGFQVADYPEGFVAELEIQEYNPLPAGIYWGQRFFTYVGGVNDMLVYREDVMMVVDG